MNLEKLKRSIRNVPDFPKPGIQFKDITTLLDDIDLFNESINAFYQEFKNYDIDRVVGIESRGFIFAAPLALKLNAKFVLARKPGKLPSATLSEEYELEYGKNKIEIHVDSIKKGDKVLVIDDLLATGGTAMATGNIVSKLGAKIISYGFLIELSFLNGRNLLDPDPIFSLIKY